MRSAIRQRIEAAEAPAKRLYKVPEAAEYLSMSTQQVRNLIACGKIRNVSIDSHARIAIEDLEALVADCKSVA